MAVFIGLAGVILGAFIGAIMTYFTTRSNMWLQLEHAHDQTLRDKRLERYQELFHLSKCYPRYLLSDEEPSRKDLQQIWLDFHNWYFGKAAGGMFLTPTAKDLYLQMQDMAAEVAGKNREASEDSPLSDLELQTLRDLASELRHQLAEDVGAANPPRLRWTRLRPPPAPPPSVT